MENKTTVEICNIESKMQESEKILEDYLSEGTTNDNKIPATVGILTAGRTKELTTSLESLSRTIQKEDSSLIASNNNFSYWSKRLSISLIVVTLIVGVLQAYVIWQTSKNQNEENMVSEVRK
ncbi:MAG: hypothetical protein AABY16_02655 [Nanoarchaeota archaeon]